MVNLTPNVHIADMSHTNEVKLTAPGKIYNQTMADSHGQKYLG